MNLVINSQFRPFTYDEMVKPLVQYKEAYDKVEQDYSDLTAQTEMWKDIANQTNSPEAYEMYNRYSNDLAAITESFSRGMNINNRKALIGMKRRYAQDITPIAQASEAMKAANELRDKLGSDAIFEVGRYSSLDDFLHGKTANNKYESRKDITSRTAALAQATAQSIMEDPIIKNSMSPQFLEVIQKRGLGSLEELQAAIAGNPAATNRFAQLKSSMIDQLGGLDRFDAAGQRAVEGAINEGLYQGLNNYQTSLQANGEYMTKAQRTQAAQSAAQLALHREQWNYKKAQDQEARDMAAGKKPIETLPDGTRIYQTSTGRTWTETPKGQKGATMNDGSAGYEYLGEDGKTYTSKTKGATKLNINGKIINATPVYDDYQRSKIETISKNPEKPLSLGYTLGVDFPVTIGNNYGWIPNSEQVVMEDPEKLVPITRGYEGLHSKEKSYIEQYAPLVNANRSGFNYYWAYYDKDGNATTPGATGKQAPTRKQLIIRDK